MAEAPLIRTELSSDLTQLPVFTEGGIEWLPVDDDDAGDMVDELIEPYDKKRVRMIHGKNNPMYKDKNGEDNDMNHVITLSGPEIERDENDLSKFNEEEEAPTFGQVARNSGEDDDSNFQWNPKHRNRFMDDDLTRFAKGNDVQSRTFHPKPKPSDNTELSDVIENDYLEDQLYAILPINKDIPTFTDKRYDTKKPDQPI
ncbi:receptor_IA-2 domain-containing protein [Caerostris extrusa]|uniref:Receptor_IA-2 domain-containing protein n=1 Tax=Caerostris extrusa TaxID=172846 RepID=A0AAV4SA59_CAEEX|nr:receptor_IA-2 domain-containing protein [Caerostris extrusa]